MQHVLIFCLFWVLYAIVCRYEDACMPRRYTGPPNPESEAQRWERQYYERWGVKRGYTE